MATAHSRNDYLDGLRALAVIAVMFWHYYPQQGVNYVHWGRVGVVLFFVLSGFLISRNLYALNARRASGELTVPQALRIFYWRRALRIFPVYYGVLAFCVAIAFRPVTDNLVWHLFYASNFAAMLGRPFANDAHFWSLCVEEQFYLVIPLLVLLLPRARHAPTFALALLGGLIFKVVVALTTQSWLLTTRPPFGNLEGLCAGALLGYAVYHGLTEQPRFRLALRLCLTVGAPLFVASQIFLRQFDTRPYPFDHPLYIVTIDLAIALVAVPLIYGAHRGAAALGFLRAPVLTYIGRISYGIYVFHFFIIPFMPPQLWGLGLPAHPVANVGVKMAVAIAIASVSWFAVERPLLRLKDRVGARPAPLAPTVVRPNV